MRFSAGFHQLCARTPEAHTGIAVFLAVAGADETQAVSKRTHERNAFFAFFKGVPLAEFDAVCREFARADSHIMRPDGMAAVRMAAAGGAQVLIVSASIDNWVAPFFESMGNASPLVVGTRVESKKERLTGRFLTPNCYGAEKVRRIKSILKEPRDNYFITAFGDSRGDKEMFEYADKSYYRPFN